MFFLTYLFVDALGATSWKYLIYLTNWGYILLTLYFLWSACSVTFNFACSVYKRNLQEQPLWIRDPLRSGLAMSVRCCRVRSNKLAWYQMIQWVLFTIGTEMAASIVILFWIVYSPLGFDSQEQYQDGDGSMDSSGVGFTESSADSSNGTLGLDYYTLGNLVPHLVNGLAAMADFWICGVPIRLFHFIYPMLLTAIYCSFTIIYYTVGGTDSDGNSYIYYVLDFKENPALANEVILLAVFVMAPVMHLVFYLMFLMRSGIHHLVRKCYWRCRKRFQEISFVEMDEPNSDDSENFVLEGDDAEVFRSSKPRLLFAETS